MRRLKNASYDDNLVREFVVSFCQTMFGLKLKSNEKIKKIDLLGIDDPQLGVEVEHGKWDGDFWKNDIYSLISGLKFRTANIPARKEKYWKDEVKYYGKIKKNHGATKNIFIRTNKDFSQILIIRPETIRDSNKLIRTKFQPRNSNEVEDWLSFKRQNVETYNLVGKNYILDVYDEEKNFIEKIWNKITHLLR